MKKEKTSEGLNKSKKAVILTSVAAFVVLIVWFLFLYNPQSKNLAAANENLSTAQSDETSLRAELAQLKELKTKEPDITADLARVNALMPNDPDLALFIREANRTATQAGIDWISVTSALPAEAGPVSVVTLGMEIKGNFFNVIDYLDRMQRLPRAVTFSTMTVAGAGGDAASGDTGASSDPNAITVSLTGAMYMAPSVEAPSEADATSDSATPVSNRDR